MLLYSQEEVGQPIFRNKAISNKNHPFLGCFTPFQTTSWALQHKAIFALAKSVPSHQINEFFLRKSGRPMGWDSRLYAFLHRVAMDVGQGTSARNQKVMYFLRIGDDKRYHHVSSIENGGLEQQSRYGLFSPCSLNGMCILNFSLATLNHP